MTGPSVHRRDGRTCDECGAPNVPRGWLDSSWSRYVDPSLDRGEGYEGLVLCVLCFAERVEQQAGVEEALAVLKRGFQGHQERVARTREREASQAGRHVSPTTSQPVADFSVLPMVTSRVFSYIVAHDTGFAPNPFHGLLTLACCKPLIRRTAKAGDIIVGLTSRSERLVYAVQVAEVLSFEEYWADPRYLSRRPVPGAARIVDRAGDNIYEPVPGGFRQLPSFHSHADGSENPDRKRKDLGGEHALVGETYTYWGGQGPALPEELSFLAVGRGHRSNFSAEQVTTVAGWFTTLPGGVLGAPVQWKAGDASWRQL
jgi:hypothetical protein